MDSLERSSLIFSIVREKFMVMVMIPGEDIRQVMLRKFSEITDLEVETNTRRGSRPAEQEFEDMDNRAGEAGEAEEDSDNFQSPGKVRSDQRMVKEPWYGQFEHRDC
jgi:hypothetical protein